MPELDRRHFLGLNMLGLFVTACTRDGKPTVNIPAVQTPPVSSYTVESLQNFGIELNKWQLSNGILMATRFPEIKRCADLLLGILDPSQYFPFVRIPIGFSILPGQEAAALAMQRIPDPNDSRRIVVITKEGQVLNAPMLARNTSVDVTLSQDVLDSSLRLPVLVKEVSQLLDYPDYARAFVNDLKSNSGVNFTLQNPNNIPTSENEVLISIINNTGLERALTGRERFRIFVDNGSFLRSGIAFANWYKDQLRQGLKPEGKIVSTGLSTRNFLIDRGLIKQEGDLFVWSAGEAPRINDLRFLELINIISSEK